ncbi:MAG TPA: LacI family DNA-binding transcriptional regulator [Lacunisphaera sp.]|jgi:DNA-binding LacI/PurR family transcriptional regulator|nr:LacI family DNA-binding transcriptional regulator [Lacunisphaera sp.]
MSKASGKTASPPLPGSDPIRPSGRYFTLADIAAKAGVHVTTVSLALRDHPSIPPATRARIRAVAKEFSYQRDPLLDALNSHRARRNRRPRVVNSAFVVHAGATRLFGGNHYQPLVYAGAKSAAEAHGHALDIFVVGEGHLAPARLNTILSSRGITAVLLSTFEIDIGQLDLDWDQFCAVKIECLHLSPHLDAISNDQLQVARLAMRQLRKLGYRRIGLATAREDQTRLAESFGMGVLIEQASLPEAECVPPLFFNVSEVSLLPTLIPNWMKANEVDVIISNWPELFDIFAAAGIRLPEDIAFACLDVPPSQPKAAGVVQNHRLVGQRAMEQLAIMCETYQRGVPEAQTITFIPGFWQDGLTAPPRPRRMAS